uniref:Lipase, member Ib n=1 Tax=Echeneis naucrates TaxID=173247 RepID=A0A665URH2_ECHNA
VCWCKSKYDSSLYVRLLLYTRSNLDCGRELDHHRLSSQPLFNLSRPTAFVIHGYRPTGAPPIWIDHIVHLLAEQEDMNVIVVDWNKGAANLNYFTAVTYTREAARNLTGFIMTMEEEGAALSSLHLIGVSLGAHLAGFVGANLKGKIGRITGLDPAGPMFTSTTPEERLDPSDAMFVDVLHTDMDCEGAHGHIDFYANGGVDQPGCPKTIFSYFVCDHQRSVFLFLCALNRTCSLTGYPCSSYGDFLDGRCLQCEAFKPASCPVLGRAELPGGHGDLESVSALGGRLHPAAQRQTLHRGSSGPVSLSALSDVSEQKYFSSKTFQPSVLQISSLLSFILRSKLLRLEQYTSTRLLAQFDEDLQHIQKISLRISTGNVIGPRYKIRLLRIRFTPLERPERSECRPGPSSSPHTTPAGQKLHSESVDVVENWTEKQQLKYICNN